MAKLKHTSINVRAVKIDIESEKVSIVGELLWTT